MISSIKLIILRNRNNATGFEGTLRKNVRNVSRPYKNALLEFKNRLKRKRNGEIWEILKK